MVKKTCFFFVVAPSVVCEMFLSLCHGSATNRFSYGQCNSTSQKGCLADLPGVLPNTVMVNHHAHHIVHAIGVECFQYGETWELSKGPKTPLCMYNCINKIPDTNIWVFCSLSSLWFGPQIPANWGLHQLRSAKLRNWQGLWQSSRWGIWSPEESWVSFKD